VDWNGRKKVAISQSRRRGELSTKECTLEEHEDIISLIKL
jgi:hypothetical protein